MPISKKYLEAREYFPRGLTQPTGSFRFSMDALLLGAFAEPKKNSRILDIGTGCGIIALSLLLKHTSIKASGLEINTNLVASAIKNAQLLGVQERFQAIQADVAEIQSTITPESYDMVISNPPYRRKNQGRLPQNSMRQHALFEGSGSLENFIAAAAFALKNKGPFYCIYPAERLSELFAALAKHKLEPKLLMPLQALETKDCTLVLLRANKNGRPGLVLKNPLLIYETSESKTNKTVQPKLTQEVLTFCPWLLCNAG